MGVCESECKKEHIEIFTVTTGQGFIQYMHKVFDTCQAIFISHERGWCTVIENMLHVLWANRKGCKEYINKLESWSWIRETHWFTGGEHQGTLERLKLDESGANAQTFWGAWGGQVGRVKQYASLPSRVTNPKAVQMYHNLIFWVCFRHDSVPVMCHQHP